MGLWANIGVMLIKYGIATIKMNNANGQLKSRYEVRFPIKISKTSPL